MSICAPKTLLGGELGFETLVQGRAVSGLDAESSS